MVPVPVATVPFPLAGSFPSWGLFLPPQFSEQGLPSSSYLELLAQWWSESHSVVSDSLWPHGLAARQAPPVHGILQAKILEWVAIPFSRGSS